MESQIQCCFRRYEKKYWLTAAQQRMLLDRMQPYMRPDRYGQYTICNIYYDTPDYRLIRASIEKPVYKEKLRVRCYGVPDANGRVFVELKKKFDGVVYKRRVTTEITQVGPLLSGGRSAADFGQIGREIGYFQSFYRTEPKVFIGYDRLAFAGAEDDELRITFDTGLRWRESELDLRLGAAGVFRRAHYGKGMGLGQRGGDQRRVGQCLEPAQKAQGHRLGHDAARQPWAGLSAGGGCMIKRLRNRFIRIATLSVAAVMLLLTVLVNTANFASTDSDLTQTLRLIEKNQGTIPLPARFAAPEEQTPPPSADGAAAPEAPDRKSADRGEHDGPFGPETAFSTRYFVLRYTEDGALLRAELDRIAAVTEDDMDEYLAVAVQRGDCYQAMRMVRTVALWSLAAEAVHHRREPRAENAHHGHCHQPAGAGAGDGKAEVDRQGDGADGKAHRAGELARDALTHGRGGVAAQAGGFLHQRRGERNGGVVP